MIRDQYDNYMMSRSGGSFQTQKLMAGIYTNAYSLGGGVVQRFNAMPPPAMAVNLHYSDRDWMWSGQNVGVVLYDTDSKSLAYRYGSETKYSRKYDPVREILFKFNDTDYTPIWMYYRAAAFNANGMSEIPTDDNGRPVYAVVKENDSDSIKLLKWRIDTGQQYSVQNLYPTTNSGGVLPDFQNAKHFAMTTTTNVVYRYLMYYATDNKVYVYDMGDLSFREVWTVPAGNTIRRMEVLHQLGSFTGFSYACPLAEHLIILSDAPDGTSTLQVCKISTDLYGTLEYGEVGPADGPKQKTEWTGLPKVVSLEWKMM